MDIRYISAVDAYNAVQNGAVLVDVREKMETSDVWINLEDVIYIPFSSFDKELHILPKDKDKPLILCCAIGLASKKAAEILFSYGYKSVFVLSNGLISWQLSELPIKIMESFTCECQCGNNTQQDEDQ